jgi:hypothetical protein
MKGTSSSALRSGRFRSSAGGALLAVASLHACVVTAPGADVVARAEAGRDAGGDPSADAAEDVEGLDARGDVIVTADVSVMDAVEDVRGDAPAMDAVDGGSPSDAGTPDAPGDCARRPFGTACAPGLVCDGRGACAIRRPCAFESAGRWNYPSGAGRRVLESVFAYGRYYNFWINPDGSYEPLNPGGNPVASVDRWRPAGNPCAMTDPCSLDSFNLFEGRGADGSLVIVESVLRRGRYFTYTAEGGYRLVSSGLLESVPQFAPESNGPCTDQFEGSCRFDTRSLVVAWGSATIVRDEITARGRRWVFDGAGRAVPSVPLGQSLTEVARYAPADGMGPCVRGSPCRFDAHFHDPTSGDEYVFARGRLFVWAPDAENTRRFVAGYGNELYTFDRYATGPCRVSR